MARMGYGRRLLHRDPRGRYTVVVMTWGPGQGTPIHDHANLWCVECVYRGNVSKWTLPEGTLRFTVGDEPLERRVGGYDEKVSYWLWVRAEN